MSLNKKSTELNLLLSNSDGYAALCAFLEDRAKAADTGYGDAARLAVFSGDARDNALIMFGRKQEAEDLLRLIAQLATNKAKTEG